MNANDIGGRAYLTPAEFAERENVCLGTIYVWNREGICPPSWKRGRLRGWWLDIIEAWEAAGFPNLSEQPAEEQHA